MLEILGEMANYRLKKIDSIGSSAEGLWVPEEIAQESLNILIKHVLVLCSQAEVWQDEAADETVDVGGKLCFHILPQQ